MDRFCDSLLVVLVGGWLWCFLCCLGVGVCWVWWDVLIDVFCW